MGVTREEMTPAKGDCCAETGGDGPLGDNADLNPWGDDSTSVGKGKCSP